MDRIGKGGNCDASGSEDAVSWFVAVETAEIGAVVPPVLLACLRGLNIRTTMRPKMMSRRSRMHFRRPVLRWYLCICNQCGEGEDVRSSVMCVGENSVWYRGEEKKKSKKTRGKGTKYRQIKRMKWPN